MGWAEDQAAALRLLFPAFDIWYVRQIGYGYTWHAKPAGTATAVVHADSPDELADLIRHAEAARSAKSQHMQRDASQISASQC
jgi:pimeloyl-ACP methyl ester carboxylesterase